MNSFEFHIETVRRRPGEVRTPGRPYPNVRRIVVVRDDKLGDFVLTIPTIAALDQAYPSAEIVAIVAPAVAPLARLVGPVDRVMVQPTGVTAAIETLKSARGDLAVCVSRGWKSAWAIWRAGVTHRVGSGRRIYSPLFTRQVVAARRSGGRHELEHSLAFAHRAGAIDTDVHFPITIPESARDGVTLWRESRNIPARYVVLHPGSGGSCPRWPLSCWTGLSGRLTRAGIRHVISAGPEDREIARRFEGPSTSPVAVFAGDLASLASLLEDAALVVSNSTGPIHLAAALGTPTLSIHAPWVTCGVARWGPYAENGRAIVASVEGVTHWTRRRRRELAASLMLAIPVDFVARSIQDAVESTP